MKKYFTSIDIQENMYIGTVFDVNSNQPIYKTNPYPSQSQAMQDVNTFLVTQKSPSTEPIPQTIINTAKYVPGAPVGQRRCCGR